MDKQITEPVLWAEKDATFGTAEKPFAPMIVIGKMNDEGLGPISWWNEEDDDSDSSSEGGSGDDGKPAGWVTRDLCSLTEAEMQNSDMFLQCLFLIDLHAPRKTV